MVWIGSLRYKINASSFISLNILLPLLMSTLSHAQHLTPAVSITTDSTIPTSLDIISTHSTLATYTSLPPNSTSASTKSHRSAEARPSPFEPANAGAQYDPNEERNEKAFNYYFLILAGIVFALAIGLWWIRRRKRRQKEQMRLNGQHALARDLDGWANSRRWMNGNWRQNQSPTVSGHEEGLNEHGEAPPPYQPKNDTSGTHADLGNARDAVTGLTIPMHVLPRDEIDRFRPPPYQASLGSGFYTNPQLNTAGTAPDSGAIHSTPSIRGSMVTNGNPP